MKVIAILSLVSLAFGSVVEKRECAGNNCNRAITGVQDRPAPLSVRQADCSSFQTTVVTPPATTVTVTVEAEGTAVIKRDAILEIRQATSNVKPTYATACSSDAAYASACNCWGITSAVSTAPTPTVTVTSTIDYCDDL
ncbi:hypothetical protein MCOR27_008270 [Pyricularia oryzae]|uniref:Uncharacterized protein n=4 Tax=Pyricularia TaxID=48558 RepID=A0ABQ8NGT2_PYRGI|nr:uncharacterized protein MGG_06953 [Pyricularia oryzae 70-15]KAH8842159.1 hypothetical protein MCOR01_006090 [Pyricularia oryzae]KAI6295484.1 hypothetical protein MCOR33_007632 [Pyricularia grisea]EHA57085.1 hypothetical protein MGG_06953 [Pyricularia oryzae 70-15]KAH9435393.1 hypothetical protein MCOR02_004333 [Pyricularia oryzae]KAI6259808.1 hypothetical protein MCOR19_003837 [Pyricularia oryzae]